MSEFPVCNTNYLSVFPFCIYVDNTKDMIYFQETGDLGGGCKKKTKVREN